MAAFIGLLAVVVVGFARSARLLENRRGLIALAAVVLGCLVWVILGLSTEDEYYGDGTTVWEHSRRSGAWVFVIVGVAAAAASIVGLVWAAMSSGGRLRSAVLPLTAVACLLLLFGAFSAAVGH
jgi:hypothetical protein